MRLSGKVALITGGASGLGATFVKTFLNEGAKVVFTDVNEEAGIQLAKELGVSLVTIARCETQNKKPQAVQYGKFLAFCEKKHIFFE